jgi:hypothetical protein
MKIIVIISLLFFSYFTIQGQHQSKFMSIYKKKSDTEFEVWTKMELQKKFYLLHYIVSSFGIEKTKQTHIEKIEFATLAEMNHKFIALEKGSFKWIPYEGKKVLFVQLIPHKESDEVELEGKRDNIADAIEFRLKREFNGQWFASDDWNNLFFVDNENKAVETAYQESTKIVSAQNLIISKRTYLDKDNWFYEVLYPLNFSGLFDSL